MNKRSMVLGGGRDSVSDRGNDLYESPPEAVRALRGVEKLPARIWEPACGPGVIARELRAGGHDVLATDLVDYKSPDQDAAGVDFLIPGLAEGFNDGRAAIVTNPPYKNAQEFVERALSMVPYCAMLLRLAFLESERRRNIIDDANLARVWVFRRRLPFMHRDGYDGPKHSNSGMAFAWFVWDQNHNGPTELRRVSWEDFP